MQQVVVPQKPANQPVTLEEIASYRAQSGLRSRFWRTALGTRLLRWFWNTKAGRLIRRRFAGATAEELHGYAFWAPVALAITVTEILGAIGPLNHVIPWPTISFTVGHLEDLHGWWGLLVVAVIATAGYYAFANPTPAPPSKGRTELYRSLGPIRIRYNWLLVYAVTGLVAYSVYLSTDGEHKEPRRFHLAYAIYGTFAVVGIAIPLLLIWRKSTHVVFPTFFYTLHRLRDRFHVIALLVLLGLAILLIHLALYPWPSLARENASFAGTSGIRAKSRAERKLHNTANVKANLEYSSRIRRILDGREAWYVYFRLHTPGQKPVYERCVIVVQDGKAGTPSKGCLSS
jgi:hypothetical protein